MRLENLPHPADYVEAVLERVKTEYVQRVYQVDSWKDHEDFLQQIARKTGRLLKGGECDINAVARKVLYDWQRGRLPYFQAPPQVYDLPKQSAEKVSVKFTTITLIIVVTSRSSSPKVVRSWSWPRVHR